MLGRLPPLDVDMTFTDDDLKRLKLLVGRSEEGAYVHLHKKSFDALLARLEAAEAIAERYLGSSND
jgi:hypothetical protein